MSASDSNGDGTARPDEISFFNFPFNIGLRTPAAVAGQDGRGALPSGLPDASLQPPGEPTGASRENDGNGVMKPAAGPEPRPPEGDGGNRAAPDADPKAAYQIGYGKPPLHTRFAKGISGNPGGRRVGAKSHATLVQEILDETVVVTEAGKRRKMSRFEFSLRRVVEKAMKGDPKAFQLLMAMRQTAEDPDGQDSYRFTQEDKAILDGMAARLYRKKGRS